MKSKGNWLRNIQQVLLIFSVVLAVFSILVFASAFSAKKYILPQKDSLIELYGTVSSLETDDNGIYFRTEENEKKYAIITNFLNDSTTSNVTDNLKVGTKVKFLANSEETYYFEIYEFFIEGEQVYDFVGYSTNKEVYYAKNFKKRITNAVTYLALSGLCLAVSLALYFGKIKKKN